MARGKHVKSAIHRANEQAQIRIAQLEAEVERLHAVENVGLAYVEALGEIERLTLRVVQLDRVLAERDRLLGMLERANDQLAGLKQEMIASQTKHSAMFEVALEAAPAGLARRERLEWLVHRLGGSGPMILNPYLEKLYAQGMPVPQALLDRT